MLDRAFNAWDRFVCSQRWERLGMVVLYIYAVGCALFLLMLLGHLAWSLLYG